MPLPYGAITEPRFPPALIAALLPFKAAWLGTTWRLFAPTTYRRWLLACDDSDAEDAAVVCGLAARGCTSILPPAFPWTVREAAASPGRTCGGEGGIAE